MNSGQWLVIGGRGDAGTGGERVFSPPRVAPGVEMEEDVMKWKTRILLVILLLLFASQGWADPLDQWRVRNQSYLNAVT